MTLGAVRVLGPSRPGQARLEPAAWVPTLEWHQGPCGAFPEAAAITIPFPVGRVLAQEPNSTVQGYLATRLLTTGPHCSPHRSEANPTGPGPRPHHLTCTPKPGMVNQSAPAPDKEVTHYV